MKNNYITFHLKMITIYTFLNYFYKISYFLKSILNTKYVRATVHVSSGNN